MIDQGFDDDCQTDEEVVEDANERIEEALEQTSDMMATKACLKNQLIKERVAVPEHYPRSKQSACFK